MLFVVPPGLPLQLPRREVLLQAARLIVEGEEQGLTVQLLKQGRVVQDGQLLGGVGGRHRRRVVFHAQRHGRPDRIQSAWY